MKIKVILAGGAVNVPKTEIGLGAAFISLWVDGNGFTCASNQIGTLGYILLETPEIDIGDVGEERQRLFTQLHGRVVDWNIKTNLFVKDGGIARIAIAVPVQQEGGVVDQKIEFVADGCIGVSVVTNTLDFSSQMLQEAKTLAELDSQQIISDDDILWAVDAAPAAEEAHA
jgi:hypothetical protein